MNINLALSNGSKFLTDRFIPNAKLDSEILMAKTINKNRKYILLNSNNLLTKNDLNNFFMLIKQRAIGNPVAYLTNKKFFLEF